MFASVKNNLMEKRWAIIAVLIGTGVGFLSALICVRWHLVIFGFNIAFIISPLIAGFVETLIARHKYGKSTGAISALLIFIIINAYAWLFPKDPIVLNFFTLGGLALMIQAAFPILINYIIFVVFLGVLTYIMGFLGNLLSKALDKISKKPPESESVETIPEDPFENLIDKLEVPIVSIPHMAGGNITKHIGMVTGEAIVKENSNGISKLTKQLQLQDMNLDEVKSAAIARMLENAKEMGANTVIEVLIDYNSIGGLKGNAIIVTATGTAVIYE
ncbi:MAG: heavy metal-binding domain-containing protein [Methanobacterium sp.]|nr:heavy metal-binding domain-containing protein [Methanobacterium sp.]